MSLFPDPRIIFGHLNSQSPIVVAVSGGSDSLALLHLASSWARIEDADLRVVTVDHGLRPEAAAEAAFVAGICESLGLPHFTLAWEGIKPTAGISEAARNARYMLMEEFSADIGAQDILTGHTCNDQAETIWMRNSRNGNNPQWRGMSGMASLMRLPSGITVQRPLLKLKRESLREYLKGLGQAWIEDPSNLDTSYERVRARQALTLSGIGQETICRFANLNGRLRRLNADTVSRLLVQKLEIEAGPVFCLQASVLRQSIESVSILAAKVLVALAGGKEYFVKPDIAREIMFLSAGTRLNAGNAIVERMDNAFRFYRETRNLRSLHIGAGERTIWDNRLMIENNSEHSYSCSVFSPEQLADVEAELEMRLDAKPRAVLQSMPVLISDEGNMFFPFLSDMNCAEGLRLQYTVPAIEHYCSGHELALLDVIDHVQRELTLETLTGEH